MIQDRNGTLNAPHEDHAHDAISAYRLEQEWGQYLGVGCLHSSSVDVLGPDHPKALSRQLKTSGPTCLPTNQLLSYSPDSDIDVMSIEVGSVSKISGLGTSLKFSLPLLPVT